jgi:O-antigen/teichoic acid export membrane protein
MIQEFIKDLVKYFPAQVVPSIVGFLSIPIITRLFLPADYGNYVLVLTTVSILSAITGWLGMSIIRFHPVYEREGELDEFYGIVIKLFLLSVTVLTLIFMAILFLSRNHISDFFYLLMRIGVLVFILTASLNVLLHFLRTKRQVNWYSAFSVWKSVTAIGFGLALVLIFHYGVDGLLWGSVLSIAVVLPLVWKVAVKKVSMNKTIFTSQTLEMARYSFPLILANLATWILSLSDRYVLGFFRGSQEVGIYSASYAISEYSILFIASLFLLSGGPIGLNIWEKEGVEKSREFVSKTTRYYLMLCLPAAVGLSVLAKTVICVLTAPEYYEGYRIVPFIVFGGLLLGLQQRFSTGLVFYKKTSPIMFCIVVAGILNLSLNFLFIPKYGYMAAAVTTLVGYAILLILMIIVSRKVFIWEFPFKSLEKITCASVVMGAVIYLMGNILTSSTLLSLIVGICVGTVVYLLLLFLLREIQEEEIQELRAIRSKIRRRIIK